MMRASLIFVCSLIGFHAARQPKANGVGLLEGDTLLESFKTRDAYPRGFQVRELQNVGLLVGMLNETFSGLRDSLPGVLNNTSAQSSVSKMFLQLPAEC